MSKGENSFPKLCGFDKFWQPVYLTLVPKCVHCRKESTKQYRELSPTEKRLWVWHDKKKVFLCIKCTAQKSIQDRQNQQMEEWYKQQASKGKTAEGMRRLFSGRRWERTQSFRAAYRESDNVRKAVDKAISSARNGGTGLNRKGTGSLKHSAKWAEDLAEQDVASHASPGGGFRPIGGTIAEDQGGSEGGEGSAHSEGGEGAAQRAGDAAPGDGALGWDDLHASGLVDRTIDEETTVVVGGFGCSDC
mmetsp:Transcript_40473/g.96200  ORF Transcript_40473/g.96200 Transcript_40473/m.96200 type:complete len:247 (+) Transcript_40473:284-1024(+)